MILFSDAMLSGAEHVQSARKILFDGGEAAKGVREAFCSL